MFSIKVGQLRIISGSPAYHHHNGNAIIVLNEICGDGFGVRYKLWCPANKHQQFDIRDRSWVQLYTQEAMNEQD